MAGDALGFIGLGNMGQPMAENIASECGPMGYTLAVFDAAGTEERAPKEARVAQSSRDVAETSNVIALSLPSVAANRAVVDEIVASARPGSVVVDTCTIGPAAAIENARRLREVGVGYVDSPVSGLKFRAAEGTLASITSGPTADVERARPLIEAYSRVLFHVGPDVGQGQRMKLLNNAILISSYVATSEALAYGEAGGLDMTTMLQVLNACSGQNFGTLHIFPKYVATREYDKSGAEAQIIAKDIALFVESAESEHRKAEVIAAAKDIIATFSNEDPRQDAMWIYPFVRDGKGRSDKG